MEKRVDIKERLKECQAGVEAKVRKLKELIGVNEEGREKLREALAKVGEKEG